MVKRIVPNRCCGVIIDVQSFFLAQLGKRHRARVTANTKNLVRLLGHYKIPIVVTLERPLGRKGSLPPEIVRHLDDRVTTLEKDFFDLTKENKIRRHLASLKRKQIIVAGCETDVCVLQSCLGLLSLGYEVYVLEELLFSSARNVDLALGRMQSEGAVFLTYKTLHYELIESVDDHRHSKNNMEVYGPFPDDLPDAAVP
jgi:nicotinamidase-related amidase